MEAGESGEVGEVSREGAREDVGAEAQDPKSGEAAEGVGRDRTPEPDTREADSDDARAVGAAGDAGPEAADGGGSAPIEAASVGGGGQEVEQRLLVLRQAAGADSRGRNRQPEGRNRQQHSIQTHFLP